MPEISVIVPVYNTAACLPRCLDSLLSQSFTDFEALLVDDGSTDESPRILADYAAKDPRFRVVARENGGLSAARNTGLAEAEGTYVAFLDSDDALSPAFLEKMHEKAASQDLDLVLCGFTYVFPDGKRVPAPTRHYLSEDPAREYVLAEPMAWARLARRRLFNGTEFREGILYEDLELMPALAAKTDKIGFVDEPLYDYVQRKGSIMQSAFFLKQLDIFTVPDCLAARFEKAGRYEDFAREIEFLFIEHLLRSAALRFCESFDREALFQRLLETVERRFPEWRKNPYLLKMPRSFRLVVKLASKGKCRAVAGLSRLKGGKA